MICLRVYQEIDIVELWWLINNLMTYFQLYSHTMCTLNHCFPVDTVYPELLFFICNKWIYAKIELRITDLF